MNLRGLLAILLAVLIAGCASSPKSTVESGERFDFPTALTPYSAAICIARNARSYSSTAFGEERTLDQSSMEVAVYQAKSSRDMLALAQIHRGQGAISTVTIWVSRAVRGDRQALAKHLIHQC